MIPETILGTPVCNQHLINQSAINRPNQTYEKMDDNEIDYLDRASSWWI